MGRSSRRKVQDKGSLSFLYKLFLGMASPSVVMNNTVIIYSIQKWMLKKLIQSIKLSRIFWSVLML